MDELSQIIADTGDATSSLIAGVVDGLNILIPYISQELTTTLEMASSSVSTGIIDLINTIFGFYTDEWPTVETYINSIDNEVNSFGVQAVNNINTVLSKFESITTTLISNFEMEIAQIDNKISAVYDTRMFTIYGELARVSVAINTPPDYLEGIIQDARSFAMGIACLDGLPYYTFLANWDSGVSNLLALIINSISLYKDNPQRIKNDVENSLIKPIFDMQVDKQRTQQALINNLSLMIDNLTTQLANIADKSDKDIQTINDLLNNTIQPKLSELQANFEYWLKNTYAFNQQAQNNEILRLWDGINQIVANINQIVAGLNYGGDLLLRIDSLPDDIRFVQEQEITDVSTRRFIADITDWQQAANEQT